MHKIKIKYYDKNIIIVNKPLGIEIEKILKNKIKNNLPNKGILNRLDKYTSGIIIIARNLIFYFFYKKMLLNKFVKKKYLTIIKKKFFKGFINLSLFKKKKIYIKKFFKKSITFYKILKNNKFFTFLNIYIKTGRTHQIRKHLKHSNINIINEIYYEKKNKFINTLHFKEIEFFYPFLMKNFKLSCILPIEMKKIFLINFLK